MCGIIGYAGPRPATPILLESLSRLEYRGYDSAGVAVLDGVNGGTMTVAKSDRRVADLAKDIELAGAPAGTLGIGHTRWATHGRPTVVNAHPHQDCKGRIHLIHNGIIENFRELKTELEAKGHKFVSETDTEVVAHLIEDEYQGHLAEAVRRALRQVKGAYALVVIDADEPDVIVGARMNAPLVVGIAEGEVFISSDITALIPYTKQVLVLGEGEVVEARRTGLVLTDLDGNVVSRKSITVDWDEQQAQKGGYPHFMLKEIFEQPDSLANTLRDRLDGQGLVKLPGVDEELLSKIDSVAVVACGTAGYAGLVSKYIIEQLARVRVDVVPASEFRYEDPIVDSNTLTIAFSQSGETADTLAAVREAKGKGSTVLAITNVTGSALAREAEAVIYMQSGPEIAVASTKVFTSMIACGLLLALQMGRARGVLTAEAEKRILDGLMKVPVLQKQALELEPQIAEMAQRYAHIKNAMFIGRGINYPVALEGALKLKEVSYVHAEGYAAGELKHGPIALLEAAVPVVAIATRAKTLAKTVSNVQECFVRDAPIIAIVSDGDQPFDQAIVRDTISVPECDEILSPLVNIIPMQLLAYHMAVERGCDVDQPRNLAKSVTVE